MSEEKVIGGRYRVESVLGVGGMGTVYKGVDTQTGQVVAIKALKPEIMKEDPTILERFAREGEALRLLNHPNIVKMLAAVEEEGNHFLIMEYVGGGSLQDLLNKQEQLSVAHVLEIALDLADALTRAHRLKIIHRDLKPANVLMAEDGTPKLTDFGVAQMGNRTRMTQGGALIGTYAYLSPEVCLGDTLDARTDIWSFGIMLYEMLAGRRPFEEAQPGALLTAIISKPVPPLTDFRPEVIPELAELIHSMLEKDRDQRIASVRLVGADLETIIQNTDILSSDVREQITGEHPSGSFATPTPTAASLTSGTPTPRGRTPLPSRSRSAPAGKTPIGAVLDKVETPESTPPIAPARRSLILWAGLAAVVVIALLVGVAFVLPALNAPAAPTEAPIVTVEPVATDHYMVLVAQLERLDGEERDFARFVVENLQQSFEDDAPFSRLTVRAYPAVINSAESALAAAEANSASVIIWGNYSGDLVELNINVGSTTPYQNLTMPRATLEQVANIRVQLANARAQSVAPQVVGVMAALLAADGITYELARNLSVVQQLTGEGITISGMSLAARYHRAVLNFFADPDAAVTELDAATELTATNPLLYSLRALIELRSGNIAAVNADTATAARLGPEDWALPLFATATAAIFFQNDPEQGVAILTQAVEAVPNNWFAYVFRATAYYSIGDYEAALRDVEQSIALGPQSNIPYTLGASIAMRQNRVDDARRLAAQALELFPDPTEVNRTVAAAFGEGIAVTLQAVAFTNMSLGQYDAALTNVQSIIDSGQATADAYLIQGLAYCNLRQYPAAIEAYGAGIELAPEFWLLYLLRAEVYQKDGNLMGALRDVQAVQRSAAAESYADLIARGMSGEEGLDCESFFSAPAS